MKRRRKTIDFGKPTERAGRIFQTSAVTAAPLPAWMTDPKLLPKSPPKPPQPKGA